MISFKTLTGVGIFAPHFNIPFVPFSPPLGFKKAAIDPLRYQFSSDSSPRNVEYSATEESLMGPAHQQETLGRGEKGISEIHVPRQRHISVLKADLLDALISMFDSKEDGEDFVHMARCLDSILHAEYKGTLEEMRTYYSLNKSLDQNGSTVRSSDRSEEALSSRQHLASVDSIDTDKGTSVCTTSDGKALKSSGEGKQMKIWIQKMEIWLKEQYSLESMLFYGESKYNKLESDQVTDSDLPIWLAAQRAVPRYEGFLSSIGPRGRLIRKFLTWSGMIPSMPEA